MFAVMQKELTGISVEALRSALPGVTGLTAYDAPILARDAFGIVAERLPREAAERFASQLTAAGVPAVAVDEDTLARPPAPTFTRRVAIRGTQILIDDGMNTPQPYNPAQVVLIAIGKVEGTQTTASKVEEKVGYDRRANPIFATHTEYRQTRDVPWIIELFFSVSPWRIAFVPHGFLFDMLGSDIVSDEGANYRQIALRLLQSIPDAARNFGAVRLAETGETMLYRSRHAFDEELTWLLWRGVPGL